MIGEIATAVAGLGGLTGVGILMQRWMDRIETKVEEHGGKIDELRDEVREKLGAQSEALAEHLAQETVFVSRLESMEKKLPNGQLDKIVARLDELVPARKATTPRKRR